MNWNKKFYYVECHTSFTYSYGRITTNVNEFNVMYIKGNVYKIQIEHNSNYISGWVKLKDSDDDYGPGGRFMVEGKVDGWIPNNYTEFFLTPIQTEREIKLKQIL